MNLKHSQKRTLSFSNRKIKKYLKRFKIFRIKVKSVPRWCSGLACRPVTPATRVRIPTEAYLINIEFSIVLNNFRKIILVSKNNYFSNSGEFGAGGGLGASLNSLLALLFISSGQFFAYSKTDFLISSSS